MKKYLYVIAVCFMFISCNGYKALPVHMLSDGMSKKEVFSIITKEPLLEYSYDGYECYRIRKRIVRGGLAEWQQYFLYFKDNKLFRVDKGERAVDYRIRIDKNIKHEN